MNENELRSNKMDKIRVFLHNLLRLHQRIMMRFLQRRGWVVFYLEPEHRDCKGTCWLKLYESEQARETNV